VRVCVQREREREREREKEKERERERQTHTHTHTHTIGSTAANKAAHLRLLPQVARQRDVVVDSSGAAREAQYATNASLDGIGGGSCGRCVGELACGYAGQVHRLFQFHRGH
jgi:hypothetical protein